jgi:hypothetical protein
MSENESDAQPSKWTLCVVCKEGKEYKNYYLTVDGTQEQVEAMKSYLVRKGFTAEGKRFFPDNIETITIKPTTLESEKEN